MDLQSLRSIQTNERKTDDLQPLEDSFYTDVATYLNDLCDRRKAAAEDANDPFQSSEVQRLTDEIDTAEEVIEAIYERRIGKIVKQASLAAAGFSADTENMTTEEVELFERVVEMLRAHRARVLDNESADSGADAPNMSFVEGKDSSPTRIADSKSTRDPSKTPQSHSEATVDPNNIEDSSDVDYR